MKHAYGVLGILLLIVIAGAYFSFQYAYAPELSKEQVSGGIIDIADETSDEPANEIDMSLTLTSPVFKNGGMIPKVYTCEGDRSLNPPLRIGNVPEGTASLVLIMDDSDIPEEIKESRGIEKFDHWALYNINPDTTEISSGEVLGTVGVNSAGDESYTGPCPPSEYEPNEHRYSFRLYALSGTLNFIKAPTLDELETAAQGMMLESVELIGRYQKEE